MYSVHRSYLKRFSFEEFAIPVHLDAIFVVCYNVFCVSVRIILKFDDSPSRILHKCVSRVCKFVVFCIVFSVPLWSRTFSFEEFTYPVVAVSPFYVLYIHFRVSESTKTLLRRGIYIVCQSRFLVFPYFVMSFV